MPSFTQAGYKVREEKRTVKRKPAPKNRKPSGKKKKKGPGKAAVISVCVFLAAALLSAAVIYLYMETRSYAGTFLPGIFLDGEPLVGMTYEQAVAKLKTLELKNLSEFTYTVECEEDAYTLTAEDLNLSYDTDASLNELYAIGREDNLLRRFLTIQKLKVSPVLAQPEMHYDLQPVRDLLSQIQEEFSSDPVNATVSFDISSSTPFVYTEEIQGMKVNVSQARDEIERSIKSGTPGVTVIEPILIPPEITAAELEENLQILSRLTVPLGEDAAAAENAEMGLLQMSGRRIEPGSTLSFNETVGTRTEEHGYIYAKEDAYGIGVSGIGGGICMASSLLYQGALMAGLEIRERNPAAALVSFCTLGEEATVSDQGLDLIIGNPTDYPVFIRCRVYVENDIKVACLEYFGQRQAGSVQILHETEPLPASTEPVYLLDKTGTYAVYNDEFVLRNEQMDGAVVTTYRVRLDEQQNEVSRETVSTDRYEPVPTCYWIGSQIR
ncbi:MAG: VanW family protein [Clostridia bacterium]|nr:VanW family protein [Clostridia bacterium]